MCRLTAYVGGPAAPSTLVFGGSHSLYRQSWAPQELLSGSVNADGWGVVWFPEARGPVRLARAEPVWFDPDLESLLASVRAPVALAALRSATPGLPVDTSGVPPFVYDGWAFVLNGLVPRFRPDHMRALRASLGDHLYGALRGVSDAETLFLLALEAIRGGRDPLEALAEVTELVARRLGEGGYAPLTMVLAHRTGVWALNGGVGAGPRNSLYVAEASGLAPGGTLLASERLDEDADWRRIPADGGIAIPLGGPVTVR
jgi:gamma-glutamyl hercynylcysteine S-oxide hydrolase